MKRLWWAPYNRIHSAYSYVYINEKLVIDYQNYNDNNCDIPFNS